MTTWFKLGATSAACILAAGMASAQTSTDTATTDTANTGAATTDTANNDQSATDTTAGSTDMAAGSSGSASGMSGERSANDVMCRDIVMLDTEMVPATLYFIAGYHEGSKRGDAADMDATSATTPLVGTDRKSVV